MASSNFPFRTSPKSLDCAEVFFKCNEVFAGDGYGTMRDSIRGAVYNPIDGNTGQFYDPETGDGVAETPLYGTFWMANGSTPENSVNPLNTVVVRLESGTFPDLAQRKVMMFCCGYFRSATNARIPFGGVNSPAPNGGNISVSCGGAFHGPVKNLSNELLNPVSDGGLGLTCNTSITGELVAICGEYTPATTDGVTVTEGTHKFRIIDPNGDIKLSDTAVPLDVTSVVTTVGDVTPHLNNMTRFGGLDFYSIVLFSFAGDLPPESVRNDAYKWMIRHHSAGHRELPPQLVGYS